MKSLKQAKLVHGRGNKATLTERCGELSIKAKAKKHSRIFQMYFPKGGN